MLTGGCYCGAIRYATAGPVVNQAICHCAMCRGTTGAPCVAWFSVPSGSFKLTGAEPARFRSSGHATRTFCPTCGTQLTFSDDAAPEEIDISTCSLDDPAASAVVPHDHTFTSSQLPWLRLADELPRYARNRSAGQAPCCASASLKNIF